MFWYPGRQIYIWCTIDKTNKKLTKKHISKKGYFATGIFLCIYLARILKQKSYIYWLHIWISLMYKHTTIKYQRELWLKWNNKLRFFRIFWYNWTDFTFIWQSIISLNRSIIYILLLTIKINVSEISILTLGWPGLKHNWNFYSKEFTVQSIHSYFLSKRTQTIQILIVPFNGIIS